MQAYLFWKKILLTVYLQVLFSSQVKLDVIQNLTHDELAQLFPRYADQVAVKAFCFLKTKTKDKEEAGESRVSGSSVLNRLRQRVKQKMSPKKEENRKRQGFGNQNAEKDTRRVEVGWANFEKRGKEGEWQFHQMRSARGGGDQTSEVPKNNDND